LAADLEEVLADAKALSGARSTRLGFKSSLSLTELLLLLFASLGECFRTKRARTSVTDEVGAGNSSSAAMVRTRTTHRINESLNRNIGDTLRWLEWRPGEEEEWVVGAKEGKMLVNEEEVHVEAYLQYRGDFIIKSNVLINMNINILLIIK